MHSNVIAVNRGIYEIFFVRLLCNMRCIDVTETRFASNLDFHIDVKIAAQYFS